MSQSSRPRQVSLGNGLYPGVALVRGEKCHSISKTGHKTLVIQIISTVRFNLVSVLLDKWKLRLLWSFFMVYTLASSIKFSTKRILICLSTHRHEPNTLKTVRQLIRLLLSLKKRIFERLDFRLIFQSQRRESEARWITNLSLKTIFSLIESQMCSWEIQNMPTGMD